MVSAQPVTLHVNDLQPLITSTPARGEEEHDAAPQPRRVNVWQLAGLCYFAVSGGPFGFEEAVHSGGGLMVLCALAAMLLLWSLPIALMTAELATMIPQTGGHIIWVDRSLGPLVGSINCMLAVFINVTDNALYPVMFTDYLKALLLTLFRTTDTVLPEWAYWSFKAVVVTIMAALNIIGIDIVGDSALLFGGLVLAPFVVLTVAGMPLKRVVLKKAATMHWGKFLTVLMWNTSGFEATATFAGEVDKPGVTYPRGVMMALLLVMLTYIAPTLVALQVLPNPADWHDGSWVVAAQQLTGRWLSTWLAAAALASALGMLCTLLCTTSRIYYASAQLGNLPRVLTKLHARYNTPHVAIIVNAALTFCCTGFNFSDLAMFTTIFYMSSTILRFVALVRLRSLEPDTERPFRIPGAWLGISACALPPILLCAFAILSCDVWALASAAAMTVVAAAFCAARLHWPSKTRQCATDEGACANGDCEMACKQSSSPHAIAMRASCLDSCDSLLLSEARPAVDSACSSAHTAAVTHAASS